MKSDGFDDNHGALETWGGAMHGLRYKPAPLYDRYLGKPSPTIFRRDDGTYAVGFRGPDNQRAVASRWHLDIAAVIRVANCIKVKADRRQRRRRVAKKIADRGGRRRFAAPAFVRRMNRGAA